MAEEGGESFLCSLKNMGHDPQEPQQENIYLWFEPSLGWAYYLGEPAELRKEQESENFFLLTLFYYDEAQSAPL